MRRLLGRGCHDALPLIGGPIHTCMTSPRSPGFWIQIGRISGAEEVFGAREIVRPRERGAPSKHDSSTAVPGPKKARHTLKAGDRFNQGLSRGTNQASAVAALAQARLRLGSGHTPPQMLMQVMHDWTAKRFTKTAVSPLLPMSKLEAPLTLECLLLLPHSEAGTKC